MRREISNIRELQKIELEIICYVDHICRSNNLRYFLAGGTLLGAIRHQGFIPWDNDVDLSMPRGDYERFIELFEKDYERSNYHLLRIKDNSNYYFPFIRIIDKRTEIINHRNKTQIRDGGVYVEIFPIDGYGDQYPSALKRYHRMKYLGANFAVLKKDWDEYGKYGFRRELNHICLKSVFSVIGIEKSFYAVEKQLQRQDFDSSVFIASTYGAHKELMPHKHFASSIDVQFEQHIFKAPIGYDYYLSQLYGDYMQLPPSDKQIPNHDFSAYWKD